MIQIAIVEDDDAYIETIKTYLADYQKERHLKIQYKVFYDGEDIVKRYDRNFDIILMDIEMDSVDGMTAAKEIRKIDTEVMIIFITNMPQYAIEGYKVEALDYVLKPIPYFAFSQRLDRALLRLNRRADRFISITSKGKVTKINVGKIFFVEVRNHYSIFHTVDGAFETKDSLQNIEEKLNSRDFFRCHKWFLVNLHYVDHLDNFDIILRNHVIQVSRSRKKDFLDALNNYISEAGE